MGSDRARVSYDPRQHYRSVVMQQGRVTLEADFNEEVTIAGEELRKETLDIVGPSGTPDDGYLITSLSTPTFDFSASAGTMYVGGLRVTTPAAVPSVSFSASKTVSHGVQKAGSGAKLKLLKAVNAAVQYLNQTDWLDHSDDPDWVDPSVNPPTTEFIYLFLREQEISAVEDSDLKDVALGGPDTAQRTRLIQHVVRLASPAACDTGLNAAGQVWQKQGLSFNPATMRLESAASLQVSLSSSTTQPDACNPQAQGGFLGADNQLIRVQISGIDQASGNPKFVWGFDDASFLYRLDAPVAPAANTPQLLHLQSRPVDATHQPQAQQAVEVLRSAAELSNGEYVASLSGFVVTLNQNYNPDTQAIFFPTTTTNLPPVYFDSTQTPRVFLRVWEQEVIFTPGTAMGLGSTGLQVTLQAPGNVFHTGDYWLFAVRPSTPQQVYPEHYLNDFQPPDGPRMWACPLATIDWTGKTPTVQDCRQSFSPLVDLVTVEHNGKLAGISNTLNFTGPGVTAVTNNPAAHRIDIQISGGGAGESSPTLLLFPYCKVAGSTSLADDSKDDTFIAISSTTADPFGPQQPAGAVTLYCYGTGLPSSPFQIPLPSPFSPLSPGQTAPFSLLGQLANKLKLDSKQKVTFEGYVIADCEFAGAYGFARVSRGLQGVNQTLMLTDSYLAIALPRSVEPISLSPAVQTVVVGAVANFTINLIANASASTDVQLALGAPGIATIPSDATVQAGFATANFAATATNPGTVVITATLPGGAGSATATLIVQPLEVSQINVPAQIKLIVGAAGQGTGTVVLNGPAPVNGAKVLLASTNTAVLQVDNQVTVLQNATTSPPFKITASQAGIASVNATFPSTTTIVSQAITVTAQKTPPPPPGGGGGQTGGGTPPPGGGTPHRTQ